MTTANRPTTAAALAAFTIGLALGGTAAAQTQPGQDHDAHHPGGAAAPAAPAAPAPAPAQPQRGGPGMAGGQGSPMPGMPGAQQGGMAGMMGGGDMGRMMETMHRRMAAQAALRPFQRIEGQLAFYRAELRITDAQQPQWNAFADAIRASAERLRQVYAQAAQAAGRPVAAPAQLERRIAALSVLTETTRAIAAAMGPLYASLSDEQKRTADELFAEHLQDMRRRGL
jgi:LTXXQ motif family protein